MSTSTPEGKPLSEPSTTPEGVGVDTKIQGKPKRPMPDPSRLRLAPRCGARTRKGTPCAAAAVKGKSRCRMHGGAKGSGAPKGKRNGAFRHGHDTCEAIARRRAIRTMLKQAREAIDN